MPQDANAWATIVKGIYADVIRERHNYYVDTKGLIIDNIKELPTTNKGMHITLPNPEGQIESYDLDETKALVAAYMMDFINEKEHNSATFINWYTGLETDEFRKPHKGTLLAIENSLRSLANVDPITDIGDESKFPLYIWALVFSDVSISTIADNLSPRLVSSESFEAAAKAATTNGVPMQEEHASQAE